MIKPIIKIIKRKDVEAAAHVKILNAQVEPPTIQGNADRAARRSRREMTAAISKWIPERRNNRMEEISAVRRFFGSDLLLLSKI